MKILKNTYKYLCIYTKYALRYFKTHTKRLKEREGVREEDSLSLT